MTWRPKFNTFYSGPWPIPGYEGERGVGLKLSGYPTHVSEFITYLSWFSCHPDAAQRILNRIAAAGYDRLTVMDHLPFDDVAELLQKVGVTVEVISPQRDWLPLYENGPWVNPPTEALREYKKHDKEVHSSQQHDC